MASNDDSKKGGAKACDGIPGGENEGGLRDGNRGTVRGCRASFVAAVFGRDGLPDQIVRLARDFLEKDAFFIYQKKVK